MNTVARKVLARLPYIALYGLFGGGAGIAAEVVKDPLVPPTAWIASQKTESSDAKGGVGHSSMESRVQVLIVGKTRKLAVVDGVVVSSGDMVNEAKVAAVRSDKVVMEDEQKTIVLRPGVEKRSPTSARAVKVVAKKAIVIPAATEMPPAKKGN